MSAQTQITRNAEILEAYLRSISSYISDGVTYPPEFNKVLLELSITDVLSLLNSNSDSTQLHAAGVIRDEIDNTNALSREAYLIYQDKSSLYQQELSSMDNLREEIRLSSVKSNSISTGKTSNQLGLN